MFRKLRGNRASSRVLCQCGSRIDYRNKLSALCVHFLMCGVRVSLITFICSLSIFFHTICVIRLISLYYFLFCILFDMCVCLCIRHADNKYPYIDPLYLQI